MAFGSYRKGARAERELVSFFDSRGYCVMRAAGSGVSSLSPDLLAFKRGEQLAVECKSVNADRLSIERGQFLGLKKWEDNTGIDVYVAWRLPKAGFRFARLAEFEEAGSSFSISRARMLLLDRKPEDLVK
ncbi:MAG: hypothetical protein QXH27_03045 [Candidatus Micrarchaeia archaeon]